MTYTPDPHSQLFRPAGTLPSALASARTATMPEPSITLNVIVFELGAQQFALPLAVQPSSPYPVVVRVINAPSFPGGSLVSLIHWDQSDVLIVNPLPWLTGSHQPAPFLMLISSPQGTLYGLPVQEPPSLVELPMTHIRPLPAPYPLKEGSGMARYIAVLPQPDAPDRPSTIHLLDLELTLQTLQSLPPRP